MTKKTYTVLFLCTGNSCRSILAEAILKCLGKERFKALSAGSFPLKNVHPITIKTLQNKGYDTNDLRSKSWNEFDATSNIDIVITVCDQANEEECPVWFGSAAKAHWDTIDPSAIIGDVVEVERKFQVTYDLFEKRIDYLVKLPLDQLSKEEIEALLNSVDSKIAVADPVL